MKSATFFLLIGILLVPMGCSDNRPKNILDGADQEAIDEYKAYQDSILAAENSE
ncbi:hypothetical protein SAMN06265222_106115 [Neorhodopirellula lusitana]|uniref:Secreted protein n=1 Tax=Neorhodopirellula lusitana TaxID=445327 RepID=A0ABY1Q4R4_9BACT|nr:hypothetical protein [Neorhodopirellula lusitana]SMP58779.1 hypothetical protein SAMN06265222_106115 [Neorhodopirellula lusitana]